MFGPLQKLRRTFDALAPVEPNGECKGDGLADAWQEYLSKLRANGIPVPRAWTDSRTGVARISDEQALYDVAPSFVDLLPWVEFLSDEESMLLDDGASLAAFFELSPVGTEGRSEAWLTQLRDSLENAIQDSFDELDENPWILQLYVQDETGWESYLRTLRNYVHPRAQGTAFTRTYLRLIEHHLAAVSKPGGLFQDTVVTQLPWRGKTRRIRLVVYRRTRQSEQGPRGDEPRDAANLRGICDRLVRGLSNAGVVATRLGSRDVHAWLLRWFNPKPTHIGDSREDHERFYQLVSYPSGCGEAELELASGTDFSQRLFFGQPRSDVRTGVWYFDDVPHRVVTLDRLRNPPAIGHLTGETRSGGDALNTLFDQAPEGTVLCITLVVTPQDSLEGHLNHLARKSVGDTIASEQTRHDLQQARSFIGQAHKLYRGAVAFFVRGNDDTQLEAHTRQLINVMLSAGLQPVRDQDEVGPLNSYLRWMPCGYNPEKDRRQWYTQLMFAQHVANLSPTWGRCRGTGHPGITMFNRGGELVCADPLNRLDRQMNAHLFLFGPTGSGKSATLNNILMQYTAIYRPRLFIIEAGNSFGLFGEFASRLGLKVNRITLAPGRGVRLAPFLDATRLVTSPTQVETLDVDAIDAVDDRVEAEQRDILGELEIIARIMITGGEEREEARMTRADRSAIRQCILDAARRCVRQARTVLPEDVRDALRNRAQEAAAAEPRRVRLLEMADAMDIFCNGLAGELFNRPGTAWPEADVTIVDLATFAREGYGAEMAVAYISLINTINNIAERDQYLGRPIIVPTDEAHLPLKNPLTVRCTMKIIKMWRKLGAWLWMATQTLDDLPQDAEDLLSMIEWLICLSMGPDQVEKLAKFRELSPSQKALILSARKENSKFAEGVILSRSLEIQFRAVPPSLSLATAMTEPEEKNQRYELMKKFEISELEAALRVAEQLDKDRGIEGFDYLAELAA